MSMDRGVSMGNFDMGRVISATMTTIKQNAAVLFISALVLAGLPSFLSLFAIKGVDPTKLVTTATYWIVVVVTIVPGLMLQGVIMRAVGSGQKLDASNLGNLIASSLKDVIPLLVLFIVVYLACTFASILFIVPGLMLFTMWCVAGPAAVMEGIGPFKALGRSRTLTKGFRWQVFGMIILGLVVLLVNFLISFAIYGFDFMAMQTATLDPNYIVIALTTLVGLVGQVIVFAGLAATYNELRRVKEGVGNTQTAQVFE